MSGWLWSCSCTKTEGRDKHVESIWLPCLDEGSTPSRSTFTESTAKRVAVLFLFDALLIDVMIKQDYLLRMIQEIISMIVESLLYKKKIRRRDWQEYDAQISQVLGMGTDKLLSMDADELITKHASDKDGMNKLELSAVILLKLSDEMGDENLLQKSRLHQSGLFLLKYIQQHSADYSLQREMLIRMLDR